MLLLRAIHHSIRLSQRIPLRVSANLADTCLASYHSFKPTDSHRHATASSHTPFQSSQRADSNEGLPNPGGRLPGKLPSFSL